MDLLIHIHWHVALREYWWQLPWAVLYVVLKSDGGVFGLSSVSRKGNIGVHSRRVSTSHTKRWNRTCFVNACPICSQKGRCHAIHFYKYCKYVSHPGYMLFITYCVSNRVPSWWPGSIQWLSVRVCVMSPYEKVALGPPQVFLCKILQFHIVLL